MPMPIIFQDPLYQENETKFLHKFANRKRLPVTFVNHPQALLQVDAHTLVIAYNSSALPIRQLIVDITHPYKGPTGFLCWTIPPISSLEQELDVAKESPLDLVNSRVASMEKDYNMKAICTVDQWASTLYLKQK
ncbi:uncharacterized protein K460DRAFT_1123 [Cucurbitaria berberidis CBS 394.84]|uniref:Uncharacterized protein n=1 Tax=Cucurbitaria berberidis CBS 394.84 TaxID=1168544 RepID=A0A9P4LCY4_9PLEO|nr:uncharacterized protein K460DRAFT_1123 [Cucurbitaria berberidis CBS 394.84]KAF1849619.1 hypothetical protein K460DRAFT_1123 [Cucurbitaria berberidis CBS 394.84]